MKAKISSRGQVIIPKDLREKFGLVKGTEVDFVATDDGLRMVRREVTKKMGARMEAKGDQILRSSE